MSWRKGWSELISQSTETNQAQVALFSLEAAAQSYRKTLRQLPSAPYGISSATIVSHQ